MKKKETDQQRLARGIRESLKKGLKDTYEYLLFDKDNHKLIGGCAQTLALIGLGLKYSTIEHTIEHTNAEVAGVPEGLMININLMHCSGNVTAEAIAKLLEENRIPEIYLGDEVLKGLSEGLPTRQNEISDWS